MKKKLIHLFIISICTSICGCLINKTVLTNNFDFNEKYRIPQASLICDKSKYEIDDTIIVDFIISCPSHYEYCTFDTNLFARFRPGLMNISFIEIENVKNHILLFTTTSLNYGVTNELFYLEKGCYIGCKKSIKLNEFNLKPGVYKLELWIPGVWFSEELKKEFSQYHSIPYIDKIAASTNITIVPQNQ